MSTNICPDVPVKYAKRYGLSVNSGTFSLIFVIATTREIIFLVDSKSSVRTGYRGRTFGERGT